MTTSASTTTAQETIQVKPCNGTRGAIGHARISARGQQILARLEAWLNENWDRIPAWISARQLRELGFESGFDDSHFSELLQKAGFLSRVIAGGGSRVYSLSAPKVGYGQQQTRDCLRAEKNFQGKRVRQSLPKPKDPLYCGRRSIHGHPELDMNTQGPGAGGHANLGAKGRADAEAIERFIQQNRERLQDRYLSIKQLRDMGLQTNFDNSHLSELLSKLGYPSVLPRSCDPRHFNLCGKQEMQHTRDQLRHIRREGKFPTNRRYAA